MLKKNTFNGGSNGTSITTGNSGGTSGDAFQEVSGATYSSTNATGSRAPLVAQLTSSGYVLWNITPSQRDIYVAAYYYLTSYPSSSWETAIWLRAGSFNDNAQIRLQSDGRIQVSGSDFTVILTTSSAIPLNQWVRIEAKITIGTTNSNGAVDLRIYSGDSPTPLETKTATGVNTNINLPVEVWFRAPGVACYLDDVGISDEGWLTPPVQEVQVAGSDTATVTTTAGVALRITDTAALVATPTITGDPTAGDEATFQEDGVLSVPVGDQATLAELAGTATAVTGQESLQLAELASINAAYTAVDAATATDTGFLAPDLTLGELVTLGEAALIQLTSADQATVGEAQSADEYIGPYTFDTGRLIARVDIAATLTAADTLPVVDAAGVAIPRLGVDTAHATDSSLLAVAVADTATLTAAPAVASAITAVEALLVEDACQLTQPVLTSDTAVLGELAAIRDLGRDITAAGPPYIRWRASTPYT